MALSPGRDTVVFTPHSDAPKQLHYWSVLPTKDKHFIRPPRLRRGEVINQSILSMKVGHLLIGREFDSIYAGSVADLHVAYVLAHVVHRKFFTFDDGTLNLNQDNFERFLSERAVTRRFVKMLLRAPRNQAVLDRAEAHYTIFPPKLNVTPAKRFIQISLLAPKTDLDACRRTLTVMLGAPDAGELRLLERVRLKRSVVKVIPWDLYLPHPLESGDSKWRVELGEEVRSAADQLIAEDFVALLIRRGFKCRLVGFDSTALFTLASVCDTSTIVMPYTGQSSIELAQRLGVRVISATELLGGKAVWDA